MVSRLDGKPEPLITQLRQLHISQDFLLHPPASMASSPPQDAPSEEQTQQPPVEGQQAPAGGQSQMPPGMPNFALPNGQRPTPEQIQEIQKRIAIDAEKMGMTVPEFIEHIKKQAAENQARMRAAQASGQPVPGPQQGMPQKGRSQPVTPGPPKPEALALAKFLRSQDLKPRTSILNGERKDMFKGLYGGGIQCSCHG